ncbi:MAG: hypothetical protein GY810_05845 [Aureispira sp.]|nr:hypothetical protein [Aureispira sp.]
MLNKLLYILCLSCFVLACNQGQPKDDFPDFTDEQLNKMLKSSPEYHKTLQEQQQQSSTNALLNDLEKRYQEDTSNINTTFAYAHQLCLQCIRAKTKYCTESIRLFTQVIDQDADFKEKKPYYNRMLCYKQLKEYEKASEDIAVFVEYYAPKPIVNHYAVQAELFYLQGDSIQACQVMQKAYQIDSLPFDSLSWHGSCL